MRRYRSLVSMVLPLSFSLGLDEYILRITPTLNSLRMFPYPSLLWSYSYLFRTKPYLAYRSFDALTKYTLDYLDPVRDFLPIQVYHQTENRNKITGEAVPFWKLPTYIEAVRNFRDASVRWQASEEFEKFRSTLVKHMALTSQHVTKIVAFACSTLALKGDSPPRSAFQHALVLSIRDILSAMQTTPSEIRCYAQDPIYTSLDERILQEAGITVLDHPRGFLQVDETSAILSIFPNAPIRQIITDIARPMLIIWNRIADQDPNKWWFVFVSVSIITLTNEP